MKQKIKKHTWWRYDEDEFDLIVQVRGVVDDCVIYKPHDRESKLVRTPLTLVGQYEFLESFKPLPPDKQPKRLCKCGCGYELSRFDPPNKLFKNTKHRSRYNMRKRYKEKRERE